MMEVNGIEFKIARIRAGYRQYEIAAQLGIHPCQLSEIESGRKKPSEEVVQRLLQILGQFESEKIAREEKLKGNLDSERLSARERESYQ